MSQGVVNSIRWTTADLEVLEADDAWQEFGATETNTYSKTLNCSLKT